MADVSSQITWFKTSNTTWETVTPKRDGDYTGEITLGAKPNPYSLLIQPGAVSSSHATLAQAKNAFRKFLLDKEVRAS